MISQIYRAAFEASTDAAFIVDGRGRYVAANERATALTGYDRPALCAMTRGDLVDAEGRLRRRDGSLIPVAIQVRTLSDAHQLEIIDDISSRKEIEDALRQSEERLRQAVRVANIGIFDHDHQTDAEFWSPELRAIYGMGPDEPVAYRRRADGLPKNADLTHPDDRARVNAALLRAHEPGGHGLFDVDYRVSHRDGGYRWLTVRSQTIFEGEGSARRPVRTIGAVRDITGLKAAEQALIQNEERLQQVIDVSRIGVFDHNHVAKTMYLSSSMREFVGLGQDETVSGARYESNADNPPKFLQTVHPEDRARVAEKVARVHREGGIYEDEHRLVRPDGSIRWISARARTTVEGEGAARHPVRTIGALLDITERKLADEERERLQLQLVQAQKMESIGRLAGGIAHDFNNMLNVICGYAELVVERLGPGHPLYTAADGILKAGRRSSALTARLLAFARRQTVVPRAVDLNDCIEKSLDMVRRLIGENVRLVWQPGDALWAVHVDPGQVDQVLMNLAANSRDAIDATGHLAFRTANVQLDDAECAQYPGAVPGHYVMLEIIDDGCGMDEETRSHVFEPFYSTKAEGRGTGLGLAIVYGIVKQHGGHISVVSEPAMGTTIRVLLPRCAGEISPVASTQATAVRKGTETVLLVEDEPMMLELARHMLTDLGYTVLPVTSPGEAIRLAEAVGDDVDLLVTDVVMPEMNGPELARRLLADYPQLRCLFVSGYFADSAAMRDALADGIDLLQKPFSAAELGDRVRRALDVA